MSDRLIFICYSRKDKEWKELVESQLGLIEQQGKCEVWSDSEIGVGQDWYKRIEDALQNALVAILLISEYSLNSDFIRREEVPRLLKRRKQEGLRILPILVKDCAFEMVEWLDPMQIVPRDRRALEQMRKATARTEIRQLVQEIAKIFKEANPPSAESQGKPPPERARSEPSPKTTQGEAQKDFEQLRKPESDSTIAVKGPPLSGPASGYEENPSKHLVEASQQTTGGFQAQVPEKKDNASDTT